MDDRKTASLKEFNAHTIGLVRGDQAVDPGQPKMWAEPTAGGENDFAHDSSDESKIRQDSLPSKFEIFQ